MKKILSIIAIIAVLAVTGCSSGTSVISQDTQVSQPALDTQTSDDESTADSPADVTEEPADNGLSGSDLKDGEYEITVDSSSSMFNITKCTLTVSGGRMTALMTMHGTGYLYLFMGRGEDAVESGYIPFVEDADGAHTFTVPVPALDVPVDCAAFSKKREQWYDRTLVFRSELIPAECFADGVLKTPASMGLADGEYTVEVTLSGGSGRASVQSPAKLTVSGGAASAEIVWSSSNYDYMRIGEVKFLPVNTDGNSTFMIPVSYLDREMTVYADTTAMSEPHEIEYKLTFDSASVK